MHKDIFKRFVLIFTPIATILSVAVFFMGRSFMPHLYKAELLISNAPMPPERNVSNLYQAIDHFFAWMHTEPLWELISITIFLLIVLGSVLWIWVRTKTIREQVNKKLQESEERYRMLFEQSPDPAVLHNGKHVLFANDAAVKLLKAKNMKQVLQRDLAEYVPPQKREEIGKQIQTLLEEGGQVSLHEETWICLDNSIITVEVSASALDYKGERVLQLTARDITERKKLEGRLRRLAHFDQLTGLPNRAYLLEQLQASLKSAIRYKRKMAVLFLDLNNFKQINDRLGHNYGDQLLKIAAKCIRTCLRETDVLGRLGGDEFVIFLPEIKNAITVQKVADKILDAFQEPIRLADSDQNISTSIGVSIFPEDGENVHELIKKADQAMYQSKKIKTGAVSFYRSHPNIISRKIPTKA